MASARARHPAGCCATVAADAAVDFVSRLDAHHLSVYRAMPGDLLAELTTDIPAVRARSAELAAAVARPPWPG